MSRDVKAFIFDLRCPRLELRTVDAEGQKTLKTTRKNTTAKPTNQLSHRLRDPFGRKTEEL